MKKLLLITATLLAVTSAQAQSYGTLTLTFTQTPHTSYSGSKNVMAVWIQDANGNFIKTRTRNVGWGTNDHLGTWATNSGGTAGNALNASCNIAGATTGATYTSFSTRTITWDGTDANGTLVADGTYKITIQSTWNHGGSGGTTKSYTFTKGDTQDAQTPADDANFTSVSLTWVPSAGGIEENAPVLPEITVFPNPSNDGNFSVEYQNGKHLTIVDVLGNIVYEQDLDAASGKVDISLPEAEEGNYFVLIENEEDTVQTSVNITK